MSRLSELAGYVGVSEATISRVLNGKPGVSEATRDAVLTALDVLGYERPHALRRNDSRLVGLVLPELCNPVFPAFAELIGAALVQRGATPVLCTTTYGGRSEAEYVDMLLDRHVSGVIFVCGLHQASSQDHRHYHKLVRLGLPVVAVNGVVDGLDLPTVSVDDAAAVDLAVRHLSDLGHERIGLVIGDQEHVGAARKAEAFTEAMRGPDARGRLEHAIYSVEGGQTACARLLDRGITGIVCGSDLLALGAVRAAHRCGLDVPRDVSVVGFDDSTFMSFVHPPMTTVRQPIAEMVRAAVTLLLEQAPGRPVRREEILFEPELVMRASTGFARNRR